MAVFSGSVFKSTVYNTGDAPVVIETRGGIPPEDVKRYRDYLEKLTRITSTKEITQEVIEAAEAITEIPLVTKQVSQIAFETQEIDFAKLEIELSNIQNYINKLELHAQRFLREQDDELALLLLIN